MKYLIGLGMFFVVLLAAIILGTLWFLGHAVIAFVAVNFIKIAACGLLGLGVWYIFFGRNKK